MTAVEVSTVLDVDRIAKEEPERLLRREWLVTNGRGGYAGGTVVGPLTRRYHALLVAALPGPLGRSVLLSQVSERIELESGRSVDLDPHPTDQSGGAPALEHLREFRLEGGLPVWRFAVGDAVLERRILMPHMQNTVQVSYRLLGGSEPGRLVLAPWVAFRPHDRPVDWPYSERQEDRHPDGGGRRDRDGEIARREGAGDAAGYVLTTTGANLEVSNPSIRAMPTLRMKIEGPGLEVVLDRGVWRQIHYQIEADRGYEARGRLWSPGRMQVDLHPDETVSFLASAEEWGAVEALPSRLARKREDDRRERLCGQAPIPREDPTARALVLAADQFIVSPPGRERELHRIRAGGDEARTVVAGYHWFTDWGRDTMISLEGLTLATGRWTEAGWVLRTFAQYVRDGLIPNLFPEGDEDGLYHTVDATLWFFQALERYVAHTGDRATLRFILPKLREVVRKHVEGTRFGIGVDPEDGLLSQGQEGYALTWMDAKVGDWVVTPRRGKPVEVNALWYNALRLMEGWLREEGHETEADGLAERAARARRSFNERFWLEEEGYLLDVVDCREPISESMRGRLRHGCDPAFRPNQVFAISLTHPVLERERWKPVMDRVEEHLWTPAGLRTLAPRHPDYRERYFGDLRARDAAYHQGTVWPWLIGPFVDAWIRANPEAPPSDARRFLKGLVPHLERTAIGTLPEIADATEPFTPRGCVSQAWSVAEMLRAWLRTTPTPSSSIPTPSSSSTSISGTRSRTGRSASSTGTAPSRKDSPTSSAGTPTPSGSSGSS